MPDEAIRLSPQIPKTRDLSKHVFFVSHATARDNSQFETFFNSLSRDVEQLVERGRVDVGFIDRDILPILGVQPALGRSFTADEDVPNGPSVVILGNDVWQRRYGGDPSVVGRSIQVNGQAAQVVGVMPAGVKLPLDFGASGPTLIWLPSTSRAGSDALIVPGRW